MHKSDGLSAKFSIVNALLKCNSASAIIHAFDTPVSFMVFVNCMDYVSCSNRFMGNRKEPYHFLQVGCPLEEDADEIKRW